MPSVDTYLSDQEKTWRDIDEDAIDRAEIDHYLAVMDTKPKLFTGEDFLANEFVNPPYLIEPFFPAGGIGIIHGKGGLGKTFLAMTIMRAICLGEPLFGIYPTTQGRVTYIQIDMTARIFQERLLAGGDFYKFEGWNVVVGTPNLMTANRTTPWVQQVHSQRPDLIIIDTLRKAHDMDENVAETPGKFYTKMRELFGATAILPLHHDKKSGDGDPDLAFRGNGAWLFDADVGM
ncbi:MAG: AAA family ATPase, partial [Nitrosopumilus sp.]